MTRTQRLAVANGTLLALTYLFCLGVVALSRIGTEREPGDSFVVVGPLLVDAAIMWAAVAVGAAVFAFVAFRLIDLYEWATARDNEETHR